LSDKELPDTSKTFDHAIGYVEKSLKPPSLAEAMGEDEDLTAEQEAHNYMNWRALWKGMPAYESTNLQPMKQLTINFSCEEDFKDFALLIKQTINLKTKSVWYPATQNTPGSMKRWIEDL
jgi:hypothetical protein